MAIVLIYDEEPTKPHYIYIYVYINIYIYIYILNMRVYYELYVKHHCIKIKTVVHIVIKLLTMLYMLRNIYLKLIMIPKTIVMFNYHKKATTCHVLSIIIC